MSSYATAVRLERVTKRFGSTVAVDAFDLEIPRGSIYGILGPNGSGKTTMIRMIMGILHPDEGRIWLFGERPDATRRTRVGYLPEERGLYKKMRVVECLGFLGELRGLGRADARRRAQGWLERLGLGDRASSKVEELSKGMQQKVQFVSTVLHDPELLVLDEPFSGLDPINQDVLEDIVQELQDNGTTILFSTHLMDQAERLCERVCLIARARRVLDGDLKELKKKERRGVVALQHDGAAGWLDGLGVLETERIGGADHLLLEQGADPQAILRRAVEMGVTIDRFELVEPRLHEIFVRHAGRDVASDSPVPMEVGR